MLNENDLVGAALAIYFLCQSPDDNEGKKAFEVLETLAEKGSVDDVREPKTLTAFFKNHDIEIKVSTLEFFSAGFSGVWPHIEPCEDRDTLGIFIGKQICEITEEAKNQILVAEKNKDVEYLTNFFDSLLKKKEEHLATRYGLQPAMDSSQLRSVIRNPTLLHD